MFIVYYEFMQQETQPHRSVTLYTIPEAAERLRKSPHTIRYWVRRHQIAFIRLGRNIAIPETAIDELLARGYHPAREMVAAE
jgi:excisionase family DNA binding protein